MGTTPAFLVGTSRGIFRVEDSGQDAGSIADTGAEIHAFEGQHVRALTRSADRLYAVVARHEIWSAPVGGSADEWSKICRIDEPVWSLHETGDRLLVGTEGAELYHLERLSKPSRSDSFAAHPERDSWYTPWGGPPSVRSIDASADGTIFVNVHVGGIHRSRDGGESWEPTVDLKIDVHQVRCAATGPIVLAPSGRGFAQSADLGASWQITTEGLDFPYMRAVAISGQTVLASASNGPHGDRGGVYRRPLASSDAFERCTTGLPEWFGGNVDTFCLEANDRLAVIGAPSGGVFASTDHGESWVQVASGLPEIHAVVVLQ